LVLFIGQLDVLRSLKKDSRFDAAFPRIVGDIFNGCYHTDKHIFPEGFADFFAEEVVGKERFLQHGALAMRTFLLSKNSRFMWAKYLPMMKCEVDYGKLICDLLSVGDLESLRIQLSFSGHSATNPIVSNDPNLIDLDKVSQEMQLFKWTDFKKNSAIDMISAAAVSGKAALEFLKENDYFGQLYDFMKSLPVTLRPSARGMVNLRESVKWLVENGFYYDRWGLLQALLTNVTGEKPYDPATLDYFLELYLAAKEGNDDGGGERSKGKKDFIRISDSFHHFSDFKWFFDHRHLFSTEINQIIRGESFRSLKALKYILSNFDEDYLTATEGGQVFKTLTLNSALLGNVLILDFLFDRFGAHFKISFKSDEFLSDFVQEFHYDSQNPGVNDGIDWLLDHGLFTLEELVMAMDLDEAKRRRKKIRKENANMEGREEEEEEEEMNEEAVSIKKEERARMVRAVIDLVVRRLGPPSAELVAEWTAMGDNRTTYDNCLPWLKQRLGLKE